MSDTDPNGLTQHTTGAKLDAGKVDMSLLQLWPRALTEVCRVGTLGAQKYTRGGFLDVANGVIRYTAALLRHMFLEPIEKFDSDPFYDTELGLPYKGKIRHDAQVAWNALSRLELKLREEEKDESKRGSREGNAQLAELVLDRIRGGGGLGACEGITRDFNRPRPEKTA